MQSELEVWKKYNGRKKERGNKINEEFICDGGVVLHFSS